VRSVLIGSIVGLAVKTHHRGIIPMRATLHPTMAIGPTHHLLIGRIPQSGFRARMRTQMGKATGMNTTYLTRQGECLAMCRAGSDRGP
jgi:hypothetical protein